MKKLSIGVRLTLWYVAIFAVGQLVFGVGMFFILRENLYDLVDDSLENQMDDLRSFLVSQKADASSSKLQEELAETYSIEHSGDYLAIYLDSGETVYCSNFMKTHPIALVPAEKIKRPFLRSRRIDGHPFRFLIQKLSVNGRIFRVEMGAPADDAVDTLHMFRSYLMMFAPFLLVVAAGVGYWMGRRALAPVDELVRTAREVSGTSLNTRLPKLTTGDELQRVSDTLNEMLDRIEAAFARITEFTADASHELRTPVSLIRTEAELALRRSRNEGEYRESLKQILLEAERTTTLIEQLLSIARADSGRENLQMKPVEVGSILRNVIEGWRQVAVVRSLQFSTDIAVNDGHVIGDETLLRRLVDILLDNAFKYTSSPGSVELSLHADDDKVFITVKDSGVGIAEEEQGKIFDRFYRVDKARARANGGAGLGLAIAQWIVTQHKGRIGVQSCLGQGSVFNVELPRVPVPIATAQPV